MTASQPLWHTGWHTGDVALSESVEHGELSGTVQCVQLEARFLRVGRMWSDPVTPLYDVLAVRHGALATEPSARPPPPAHRGRRRLHVVQPPSTWS